MIILINHFIIFLKLLKDLMRNDEEGVDQIIGGTAVPKWQHNYMVFKKSSLIIVLCTYDYIAIAYNNSRHLFIGIFEVILSQHFQWLPGLRWHGD